MNNINIRNLEYSNETFESQIDFRKNCFRISDKEIQDKVIYAFFLDRFHPKDAKEQIAYENLKGLEWSSGFLSLRSLENLMIHFLKSKYAEQLTPETLNKLNHFVLLLENAKEHYAEIDLFLSSDITLDLLAATGNPLMLKLSIPHKLEIHDVEEIVNHCMNRIKTLKKGESALFQGGTRIHVAPFTISLREDGRYEVHVYNTTSDESSLFENLDEVKDFVFQITNHKLDPQMEVKIAPRLTYFLKEGASSSSAKLRKEQLKNTCHTKGLLTLLFKIIKGETEELRSNPVDTSWNDFKTLFGQFLLDQKIDKESTLYQLSKSSQETHYEKKELYHLIKTATEGNSDEMQNNKNEYKRLILGYIKDPRSLYFAQKEYEPEETDDLIALHRKLAKVLTDISSEEIEKIAASSTLPAAVRKSLTMIAKQEKISRQRTHSEIEKQFEELKAENTHFHKIIAGIVKKCRSLFDIRGGPNRWITLKNNISSEELNRYMTLLIEKTKDLEGIRKKHAIVHLLMQTIEEGGFDDFFKLYENLSEKDQKKLQFYIQRILSVNPNKIMILDINIMKKIKDFDLYGNMFNPIITKTLTHLIESNQIDEFEKYFSLIDERFFQYFSSKEELSIKYWDRISQQAQCHNLESLLKLSDLLKEHETAQHDLQSVICKTAISEDQMIPFLLNLIVKRNDIKMLTLLLEMAVSNKDIDFLIINEIHSSCMENIQLLENSKALNSFLNLCLNVNGNSKEKFMSVYNKISDQTKEQFLLQANATIEEIAAKL